MITEPAPIEVPLPRLSGRRRALIWALVVLASLIGLGSILTTWVHRQMLDEQAWREASAELIQNERVREALSVYLVNELYANVDVSSALAQELPPALKGLAPTAAGALRQPATDAVDRLLDAPHVQQLFIDASSLAQSKLVNVLENKTGHGISTGSGVVTLDLGEVVQQLGTDLGLPASALDRIPPDAGVITVMRSDQLSAAQAAVQAVRVLSALLLVLVLALYALAIYLAHGARRETLRNIGWAVVLVGLIVLVVRRVGGSVAVEALTTPSSRDAGHQVWLIGTAILGDIGWAAILYGAHRPARGAPGRSEQARDRGTSPGRARAQRPAGHRVGDRRLRLPAGDRLGRHARAANGVGNRAARRAAGGGSTRVPPPNPA